MGQMRVKVGRTSVTVHGDHLVIDIEPAALTPEQQQRAARLHEENEWREGRGPKPTWWDARASGEGEGA